MGKNKVQDSRRRRMQGTGFTFTEEATNAITKIGHDFKWVICKIPDGTDSGCELVASGAREGGNNPTDEQNEASFTAMVAEIPDDQPRWCFYDLNFQKGGVNNFKILFINYVPDACTKNLLKFAYANHKDTVKSKTQVNKDW